MGHGGYDLSSRSMRTASYCAATTDSIFTQQKSRKIHKEMDPKNFQFRECRNSEKHPDVLPVLLFLDETGSMTSIPANLIKTGLPTLMDSIIQKGGDISLMFGAIGDVQCDHYGLQVGQFESGDLEMDTWLTRTFLEGGGGGNRGESYNLAWHFAANCVQTDAWDKKKKRGVLITIGDEPNLPNLSANELFTVYGRNYEAVSSENILKAAQEKFYVYHIHVTHSSGARGCLQEWKTLLGQNCLEVADYTKVPGEIAKIVLNHCSGQIAAPKSEDASVTPTSPKEEMEIL